MVDLALSQIYTRVSYLWKSVVLDNAWIKDYRPFICVFARLMIRHTCVFGVAIPNYAYGALYKC